MDDDNTTIDISSSSSRKVSETEMARREAAKEISPLDYWKSYCTFRQENHEDATTWTRKNFLQFLQMQYELELPPSGSAISGKHNYCTDTLIPSLGKDPESEWFGLTKAHMEKATLPPTARDTKSTWAKDEALASATKDMFGD